ncbi:MAG: glycosyltransferase family 4 protein [Limnohabitans sp.]|uniref:glycosyltransferase family 4 protein n=1 Tax=Limnohabitans sp. TaxID=1907725 RepID=UPI0039189737
MSLNIVLFYKDLSHPGGAERLVVKEWQYLSSFGHQVKLLTYRAHSEALYGMSDTLRKDLVILDKKGLSGLIAARNWLAAHPTDWVISSSGHIDVYLLSLLTGVPYLLHIHHPLFMSFNDLDKFSFLYRKHFDSLSSSNYGAAEFRQQRESLTLSHRSRIEFRARLYLAAVKRASKVLVLSEYSRVEKRQLFGIEAICLQGAFDADIFQRYRSMSPATPPSGRSILTVARLVKDKRIDVLLRAFARFLRSFPGSRMVIVGKGPEQPALLQLAAALGISADIEILGYVEDDELQRHYWSADIFASIDWADFRLTAFEALAAGKPVVLSNETDLDPRLMESGYVHLVPPEEDETLRALEKAASVPPKIDDDSLVEILRDYTWDRYFRRIESLVL